MKKSSEIMPIKFFMAMTSQGGLKVSLYNRVAGDDIMFHILVWI